MGSNSGDRSHYDFSEKEDNFSSESSSDDDCKDNHGAHGPTHEHHSHPGRLSYSRRHGAYKRRTQAYAKPQGIEGHGNQGQGAQPSKLQHRRMPISNVKMPSGKFYNITNPVHSTLKCGRVKLINLHPNGVMGSKEYGIVSDEMDQTIMNHPFCKDAGGCFRRYHIVKIQKIIQGCVWRKYQTRKKDVELENGGNSNERMLFHGTPEVRDIIAEGFDERKAQSNGKMGAGLYFASNSSAANQFVFGFYGGNGCKRHRDKNCHICERKLLLCRVTLGKSKEFMYSSLGQMTHADPGYHSSHGKPGEGGFEYDEFVVYRGEQVYPEYLITYTIVK